MDPRRAIPAVERLLASDAFVPLLDRVPRTLILDAIHHVQDEVRARISASADAEPSNSAPHVDWYAEQVALRVAALQRPSLRAVINATGVVLHTNLGRAPLPRAARTAIERVARSYSNLEYDIDSGARGSRYTHCALLLAELTGAEAALVVNNNAAALVLALNTLSDGKDALISRGELVEIGGSFRIPDIVSKSGARIHEVGATNRVHRADYEQALGPQTGALLKVHRSNFRMSGYTSDVSIRECAELAHAHGVCVVADLGSGLMLEAETLGLPPEPTAREALRAGADVVTMSGDKLLGGPQAGIILGSAAVVARMRANPLCRALRVDKLTLAALEATLALYRDPAVARREIPTLSMLTATVAELESRATQFAARLARAGIEARTQAGSSAVGGGAYPEVGLATTLVVLAGPAVLLEEALRRHDPAVVARIQDDCVTIDLRTVLPEEEDTLFAAVTHAAR